MAHLWSLSLKLLGWPCLLLEVMYLAVTNLSYIRGSSKGYHLLFNYHFCTEIVRPIQQIREIAHTLREDPSQFRKWRP